MGESAEEEILVTDARRTPSTAVLKKMRVGDVAWIRARLEAKYGTEVNLSI
jgi:hypothetical protein